MLITVSGGHAERVILAEDREVHRCPVVEPAIAHANPNTAPPTAAKIDRPRRSRVPKLRATRLADLH
jgi:hypothetical protein